MQSLPMLARFVALLTVLAAIAVTLSAQVSVRWTATGNSADGFGSFVYSVGDVDGDGVSDVAVAAPTTGQMLFFAPGAVSVLSGADGSLIWKVDGDPFTNQQLGQADGIGDVNGDGHADVVVCGLFAQSLGRVYSGLDGSLLFDLGAVLGGLTGDSSIRAVAGAGDVNADGIGDIVVGRGVVETNAWVFSGADASLLLTLQAPASVMATPSNAFFGAAVAGAGDVNGDGHADVIVGQGGNPDSGALGGTSATVYSGIDGTAIFTFTGSGTERLGASVASAGDIDGDGVPDIAVGQPHDPLTVPGPGALFVFSGATGATLLSVSGATGFGSHVSDGHDVNGDGVPDLGVDGQVISGADGSTLSNLGGIVSTTPDVSGDGLADVIRGDAGAGIAEMRSTGGTGEYGVGADPAQTLLLVSSAGTGPLGPSAGLVIVSGAAPGGAGALLLSTASAMNAQFQTTLLVDTSPGALLFHLFNFDAGGGAAFPLNLRQPVVAGQSFFLQSLEANAAAPGGVFSSNGLEILFTN